MEHVLRCKQCDAEMTLLPLPSIEGEAHGLHVRIDGLPALRCANGHRRFVAPTFPTMLLDQLLSVSGLVPLDSASEKGFLRKRYCCPSCGGGSTPDASPFRLDQGIDRVARYLTASARELVFQTDVLVLFSFSSYRTRLVPAR